MNEPKPIEAKPLRHPWRWVAAIILLVLFALFVVSAARNLPTPAGLVAFGEVGLTGEVRATVGIQRRLAEAARLGFDQAIVPLAGSQELRPVAGMQVLPVGHVGEAVGAALPRG